MPMRLLLMSLLLAMTGCTTAGAPAAPEPVYYVVRHLHTPEGQRDPDLLPEGRAAAQRLAAMLESEPPAVIYVSHYKRTAQTAAPIAARLGLTPLVYDPADTPALAARVRQGPWPVLIVGHSNTVPDIVAALGGARPAPLTHPDFGDVWRISADGTTTRTRIP
jgi:broad specificity phosphatase PhoE